MHILSDNYNRHFSYLRLSITDLCNFSCKYCVPDDVKFKFKDFLTINEIYNLMAAFSELGINKVRVTGGEPTIRKDFISIGQTIASFSNIKSLVFTTNGYKLSSILSSVCDAGFNGINVSLDTLNRGKFYMITKRDYFNKVLEGIFFALNLHISVKINIVLSKFFTFDDFEDFYSLLKYKNLIIRFIDQMETVLLKKSEFSFVTSENLIKFLNRNGWKILCNKKPTDGPALVFENDKFLGRIGIISPYSSSFCLDCNRLRISSLGNLFLCLFGSKFYSIRHFLDTPNKKILLQKFLIEKIKFKTSSHLLHQKDFGLMNTFSSIGG